MSDTGAYTDTIFHLLGYQFSPRLADIGGTRFWRVDGKAETSLAYVVVHAAEHHRSFKRPSTVERRDRRCSR